MAQTIHAKERGYPSARVLNPFLLRSWLIFPALKERFIQKTLTLKGLDKPDAVIFDLEDSIKNTREAKEQARTIIKQYLISNEEYETRLFSDFIVGVRINNSPLYRSEDIRLLKLIQPHIIVIPKVETRDEVVELQKIFPKQSLSIIIETLKGYQNREEIICSLRAQDTLALGYEDLSAQLGLEQPTDLSQPCPLTHITNSCMVSAKQHKVIMVEGPSRKYGSQRNLHEFEKQCGISLTVGFQSKVAIHPSQIRIINTIFDKKLLIRRAQEILAQFASLKDGTFVIATEEKEMMDTPSYKLYSEILERLKE